MAVNNQIGSGAVVLVTNADKLVAGLKQAEAETNNFAKRTQSKLSASMSEMWERDRGMAMAMAQGNWSQVLNPPKPPKPIDTAAAAHAKSLMDGLAASSAKSAASIEKMNTGLGGIAKGLKLSEAAGMGLLGILTWGHKAAFDSFARQHNEKLESSTEEAMRLIDEESKLKERIFQEQQRRASKADAGSFLWGELRQEIDVSTKSLDTLERRLNHYKEQRAALESSFDRHFGKGTIGQIPIYDTLFRQNDQGFKLGMDVTRKRYEDLKKHIEAMKGLGLIAAGKDVAAPIISDFERYMSRLREFADRVVGNHKAIQDATRGTIRALEDEAAAYDMVGMSAGEAAVFDAKRRGETNEGNLAEIRIKAEANERRKNKIAIDEEVKAMEKQAAAYGLTAFAAKRKELIEGKATAEQLARYDAATERMNQIDREREASKNQFAAAVLAGSREAYSVEMKLKYGSSVTDPDRVNKDNGKKLDKAVGKLEDIATGIQGLVGAWQGVF